MITHIVLFTPKPELSEHDRQALIAALQRAIDGIPTIRRASIGQRFTLGRPGYESLMREHYEYAAIFEFDSEADLIAYLDHPAHQELGQRLFMSASAVLAYDYRAADSLPGKQP